MRSTIFATLLTGLSLVSSEQTVFSVGHQFSVLTAEIDEYVSNILNDWNSSAGISIAIVQKREDGTWNTETKGYGFVNAAGDKVSADTLFSIGSNSKLFDVIAAGLLVSNTSLTPRISWNTKLISVLPDWKLMDPIASAGTTIVDAMSHRTGLPGHDVLYHKNDSLSAIIKRLRYLRPSAEFREIYQYCNAMYGALSYLPQALVGNQYEEYVKTHILDPLGMNSTTFSYDVAKRTGHLADGMGRDGVNKSENLFGRGIPRPLEYWNKAGGDIGSFISGAGGILMSAKDAAIWLQTLLLGGVNPTTNKSVIPPDVIQKALTGVTVLRGIPAIPELSPVVYPEFSPVVYGGAQGQYSYRGHLIIEHGGAAPGFFSQIARLPFSNFGIAVFSNDDSFGTYLHQSIEYRIIDKVLGLDPIDWSARLKLGVQTVYDSLQAIKIPPPAEDKTTPPLVSFEDLEGVYTDLGYGDVELCLVPMTRSLKRSSPSTVSCKKLVKDLPTLLPGVLKPQSQRPSFIVNVDRLFVGHFLLEHFDGNVFNVSAFDSQPTGNSSHPYWARASVEETVFAEFARNDETGLLGFALGNIWVAGPTVPGPCGATVQERAEVWFDKL